MAGALLIFAGACVKLFSAVEIEDEGCSIFEAISAGPIPRQKVLTSPEFFCHHFGEKIVSAVRTCVFSRIT